MKAHKWSETLAKSKLSPERRARIQADVEQELLEMNLQELRKAAGVDAYAQGREGSNGCPGSSSTAEADAAAHIS